MDSAQVPLQLHLITKECSKCGEHHFKDFINSDGECDDCYYSKVRASLSEYVKEPSI